MSRVDLRALAVWPGVRQALVGATSLGWRPDGSRIRRKVTGRTKTEVREKLKKLQAEADAGPKTSASCTVAKAVDGWAVEALDGLAGKLSGHMWTCSDP